MSDQAMMSLKPYPWTCGECRQKAVQPARLDSYDTEIEHDGRVYSVRVANLDVNRCRNCGNVMLGEPASRQVSDAFRATAGLMTPEQIRRERQSFRLSQKDLASMLDVAEATVSRWETGTQIQQRAMDKLLRLFFQVPEARRFLGYGKSGEEHARQATNTASAPLARGTRTLTSANLSINELWHCGDEQRWEEMLARYWDLIEQRSPKEVEIERKLARPDLVARIAQLDPRGWYDFLYEEYFPWKYDKRRLQATRDGARKGSQKKCLKTYETTKGGFAALHAIKQQLLSFNEWTDIRKGLGIAKAIHGLGTAGASGLLALMYPSQFGTVDQFVVEALCEVQSVSKEVRQRLVSMKPKEPRSTKKKSPKQLSLKDGEFLIGLMRAKAEENNRLFNTDRWTPRKIDMVLWAYRRPNEDSKEYR